MPNVLPVAKGTPPISLVDVTAPTIPSEPCSSLLDQASHQLARGVPRNLCTSVGVPLPVSAVDPWSKANLMRPSMLVGGVLILVLIVLAIYTVYVELHKKDAHDYRYFRRITVRRWLWMIYLAVVLGYFMFTI